MSNIEHDPGGENILDNPEAPYDGTPYASEYNIDAATHNCELVVRGHVDGLANALYMGQMTQEEVDAEYKAGLYCYVFLQDESDPDRYMAVSLVEGGEVKQEWMTSKEIRTWHPYHEHWRGEKNG